MNTNNQLEESKGSGKIMMASEILKKDKNAKLIDSESTKADTKSGNHISPMNYQSVPSSLKISTTSASSTLSTN